MKKMFRQLLLPLIGLIVSVQCNGSGVDLPLTIPTTFVNGQMDILNQPGDEYLFTAPTCGHYDSGDFEVTVQVFNPNNPRNDPNQGITYLTVTNTKNNGTVPAPKDAICTTKGSSPYTTTCTGTVGKGDIYVYVTGNNRNGINFAISVKLRKIKQLRKLNAAKLQVILPGIQSVMPQELEQVITFAGQIDLPYGNTTLIHIQFCPTPAYPSYGIRSIFQADDPEGKSLISQVICTSSNCNFDTTSVIVGQEIADLPVNIAYTTNSRYSDLWIYAVAHNGELSTTEKYPIGMFRFGVVRFVKA